MGAAPPPITTHGGPKVRPQVRKSNTTIWLVVAACSWRCAASHSPSSSSRSRATIAAVGGDADDRPTLNAGLAEKRRPRSKAGSSRRARTSAVMSSRTCSATGGMGVVYAATHPLIGKRAAIKVLKPELSHEPAAVERFVSEARAVNQIGHPNIVDIFDFGHCPTAATSSDGLARRRVAARAAAPHRARSRQRGGVDHRSRSHRRCSRRTARASSIAISSPTTCSCSTVPGRWPEVRSCSTGASRS